MAYRSKQPAVSLVIAAMITGCTGTVEPPAGGATGVPPGAVVPPGTGGSMGQGQGGDPVGSPTYQPAPARLRRLTSFEYKNSVVDLLGPGTVVAADLEKDASYNNLTAVAASTISLSASITEQFETSASALAESLVKDPVRRQKVVGCTPKDAADAACMRSFVTSFGRRALRRPLTAEEVDLYAKVGIDAMGKLADFWGGVQYTLAALLQSPSFIYRAELGSGAAGTAKRPLNAYELASRLSYLLRASTPDDSLLQAAADGTLSTPAGLQEHTLRLLGSPSAQASVVNILSEMLRLNELDDLPLSPETFPVAASPTLGASMRQETQNVLRDLVFARDADYREFFTSTTTSVNAELAKLYGVASPPAGQFASVKHPADGPRAGFLGHASFLALNSHPTHTSPTHRGLYINATIMCNSIPPPPEGVVAQLQDKDKAKTLREQLKLHQEQATCAACHAQMDPMGLALEHFDAVGAYRATDRGMPLDVTGTLANVRFDGARELGQVLANGAKTPDGQLEAMDCLVRNIFRAATGHLEGDKEEGLIGSLANAFAGEGFRVRSAIIDLINSEAFRFVGEPE